MLDDATLAWIERAMGRRARVARVEAMAISSTTQHRIDVVLDDGSTRPLVLRRYHDAARRAHDPWYDPAHEAKALRLANDTRLPAPHLFAADLEPAFCDVPALLESWMPGVAAWQPGDLDAYLARAAEVLVRIHAVTVPSGVHLSPYAAYRESEPIVTPPFSTRPGLWEHVAEFLERTPRPSHRATFIHRDYHPGNVLWDGSQVTGVIDWATAALGPPGIDIARMRLNLAAHFGKDAADRFTAHYVSAGGDPSARHPYWDLLDAADAILDIESPLLLDGGDFRRFEDYVASVARS